MFLQETRLTAREFEVCKFRLGFSSCSTVDGVGRKGGIALLWGRDVSLSILSYSHYHIDVAIEDDPAKGVWFLTGIYGCPVVTERFKTWSLMRTLCWKHDEPWLVLGDFNELLHHHEKWGGNPRPD